MLVLRFQYLFFFMIVVLPLQFSLYVYYNCNLHLSLSRPYLDAIQNILLDSTDTANGHRNAYDFWFPLKSTRIYMAHSKVLFKMKKQHNQYKANKNKKIKC